MVACDTVPLLCVPQHNHRIQQLEHDFAVRMAQTAEVGGHTWCVWKRNVWRCLPHGIHKLLYAPKRIYCMCVVLPTTHVHGFHGNPADDIEICRYVGCQVKLIGGM